MDPIQRKITPNIEGPQTPAETPAPAGPTQKFDLGALQGQQAAQQAQPMIRPAFDQMASRIKDAVGRSLSKDQVREELIGDEAKQAFGPDATPEMTTAIADAFKNDPHLSQLFNQLYAKATEK